MTKAVNVRRLRIRAWTATLLLAVSVSLASCLGSDSKSSMVPWAALASVSTTTTTTTTSTLPAAPHCTSHQLRATAHEGGAGLSNILSVVDVTNTGTPCRLSGYPDLLGSISNGPPHRLRVGKTGTYFGNMIPTDLATGQRGQLFLGTDDACGALNEPSQAQDTANARANTYHRVIVVLPGGGGALNPVSITFDVACGLSESQLGAPPPVPGEIYAPPGTPQTLTATVNMGSDVQSGTTLKYVVSLRNPTKTTVSWRICPNFTESILVIPTVGRSWRFTRTYQLNCAHAKNVLPGRTVSFRMELPIAPTARSAVGKFSWQLDTGDGPFSGRGLYVFAAS